MKPFRVVWLLFPILGSLLAQMFRVPETDWKTFRPYVAGPAHRKILHLPDGSVIHLTGVPDEGGAVRFWLGERELSRGEARALGIEAAGRGISAGVSLAEARVVCERLSELSGYRVRLPTLAEWRTAARGGIDNAEVPWGFGLENVPRTIQFARKQAPREAGPRMGFGFRDLAGGLWEWTQEGQIIGGAWSEHNPEMLSLSNAVTPPEGYRDADAGVRLLLEPSKQALPVSAGQDRVAP